VIGDLSMANSELILTIALVVVPAAVSLVVGALSASVAVWLQRDRLRTELKLEFATEAAIQELLSDERYSERKRTLKAIEARLKGLEGDDLRRALIRAGAVSFRRRKDGAELWGLRALNQDLWKEETADGEA
jgi:hypothetical protein